MAEDKTSYDLCPEREENRKIVSDFIVEMTERLELKLNLLEKNTAAIDNWPEEDFFSKKDSTLKKNTAFVKKIRNFSDAYKKALRADFEILNLSKYVGEVATAVTEAKIKITDIAFMLQLCSLLYQRYSDFSGLLVDAWRKTFSQQKTEKSTNLSKVRIDLVLFADLITIGVLPECSSMGILSSQLTQFTTADKENFTNIGIITSFIRACGDDWAGLVPRKIRLLSEKYDMPLPRSQFLSKERKTKCRGLFHDYFNAAQDRLNAMAKETRRLLASNRTQLINKGELHPERREKADQLTAACRKFHESIGILADVVDKDPPLPVSTLIADIDDTLDTDGHLPPPPGTDADNWPIFEDEDTRLFYESLQDIKAMIPGILYKESEQLTRKLSTCEATAPESSESTSSAENLDLEKIEHELAEEESIMASEEIACPKSLMNFTTGDGGGSEKDKDKVSAADEREEEGPASARMLMETFLTQLTNCVNRDLIDQAAIDFCLNLNRKPNRRRLAKALLMVPWTRIDLLPFYSRLVASLHPVMPDLSAELNQMLIHEFRYHVFKRDPTNIERKLKTVRFIGELVKFGIFPKDDALTCIKRLLPDFVNHHIEMACALLDTCGRYLYRSPASHHRTKIYLEIMLRKKTALHMDARYATMIENSFYYCDPPKNLSQFGVLELTPVQRFLRHLILKDLDRNSVNRILKLFRKIDWSDASLVNFVENLFTGGWQVRFQVIGCLASILSGLSAYHKEFTVAVVDNIIEDVRAGMDFNNQIMNQRRLSMIKYLGLLYNYKLIDSPVVFSTLYSLITFGVSLDYLNPSLIDPPSSLNRIPLVCILLDTSGCYFDRGNRRRKLNVFLIYFQRYFWSKRMHPIWLPPVSEQKKQDQPIEKPESNEGVTVPQEEESTSPQTQLPELPLDYLAMPFPSAIEQQYDETLRALPLGSLPLASNLAQAEALVTRLELRYAQRVSRLKSAYGLAPPSEKKQPTAAKQIRLGQMETISEDAEIDEDDEFPLEDEDDDEDEFEDGSRSQDMYRCFPDNGDPRMSLKQKEPDVAYDSPADVVQSESEGEGDEEDMDDDEEDEEDEGVEESSEEDELVRLGLKPKLIHCPEDDEFVAAFEKMSADVIMSAGGTSGAGGSVGSMGGSSSSTADAPRSLLPSLDSLPARHSLTSIASTQQQHQITENMLATLEGADAPRSPLPLLKIHPADGDKGTVAFSLVVRKQNRPRLVPIAVPETVPFAARLIQLEAAELAEKARLKQRVLEMHKAQKEAEETEWGHLGSDMQLAYQVPTNVNRDRWVKYNHPKGAPDADAVFGSSSSSIMPPNPPIYPIHRNLRR